jgi:hypothetical protein
VTVDSGDRTSPASCIAACSSALVGNLIGDLALVGVDNVAADGLPHKAVALLTDENVDFSGDGSSFLGDGSAFGGAISFRTVGFGLPVAGFVGGVGNGRENRDCNGAGDGDGDAGVGVSADCGRGDLCGVLIEPETPLSLSREAGFFGTPGEDVRGEAIDSGLGDFLGTS